MNEKAQNKHSVYRAVSNFLDNTCGANPGEIRKLIDTYVMDAIKTYLDDYFNRQAKFTDEAIQKEAFERATFYRQSYERFADSYIKESVREEVRKAVESQLRMSGIHVEVKIPAWAKVAKAGE